MSIYPRFAVYSCQDLLSRLITSIETRNVRFFTFVLSMKDVISAILILVVAMFNKFCQAQNKALLDN